MRTLFLLPLAVGLLSAGEYSKDDREALVSKLNASRQLLAVATSGLTAEQGNFKPTNEVWSITEVIEHLTLTEDYLFGFLHKALEGKPVPDDQPLPNPSELDRQVYEAVSDRSQKAKAPEQAKPQGNYRHWEEAMVAFSEKRGKTINFVEQCKGDLRRYFVASPAGKLDGHQWLLMIAAHTARHVKQIEELRNHEQFPKSN